MPSITFQDPWDDNLSPEHHLSTMAERTAAGPSRKTRKGHHRSNNLTLSLSPRVPPGVPLASPQKPSTARSMPASMASPESRVPSINRTAATTNTSPDSFCPFSPSDIYRLRPPASRDTSSCRSQTYRPTSSATVRGQSVSERGATPPLTPFPPWISDSEDEEVVQVRRWPGPNAVEALTLVKNRGEAYRNMRQQTPGARQWALHSIVDGFILALQTVTALAVFSALISVALWKNPDSSADLYLWSCLGFIVLLCSGSLAMHEARTLTAVVLLYLQSAILAVTTATSLVLWARCLVEENLVVRGVVMGCNVFMWGLSFLGFVRGVVLWRVEDEDEREHQVEYGTFAT